MQQQLIAARVNNNNIRWRIRIDARRATGWHMRINQSISSYSEYKCNDYHLDTLIEESQYFIVSPKDIVVASLYENDDRIKWLIEHG